MSAPTEADSISEVINVRQFLNDWICLLELDEHRSVEEHVSSDVCMKDLGVPNDVYEELTSVCCPDTLKIDDHPRTEIFSGKIPQSTDLVTLQLQAEEIEKRNADPNYKKAAARRMKYKACLANRKQLVPSNASVDASDDPVKGPEVILSVVVYQPYVNKRKMPKVDEEFLVLGNQCLTELRDRISCTADYVVTGEFSEQPDYPQDIRAKDLYKSGFFYIEGTFFNDMRHGLNSRDYSSVITNWAKDPKRGIGPFTCQKMEDKRFIDLDLRIGQPYLYMHQGDCEHLVVFKDLRLIQENDIQETSRYPLCVYRFAQKRVVCFVCGVLTAKWQVKQCQLAVEDPSFFCDLCFRSLLYDENNCKVTHFKAYPYLDRTAIIP